jgi:hypothetical protein
LIPHISDAFLLHSLFNVIVVVYAVMSRDEPW